MDIDVLHAGSRVSQVLNLDILAMSVGINGRTLPRLGLEAGSPPLIFHLYSRQTSVKQNISGENSMYLINMLL